MRGFPFIFTWTAILILFEPHHDINCQESKMHDRPTLNKFDKSSPTTYHLIERRTLTKKYKAPYVKKFPLSKVFKPMRIHPHFSLSRDLLESEKEALMKALMRAIAKISKILSVNRQQKSLLLSRNACLARVKSGPNEGKCSRKVKKYTGERCMDNFKIPSEHLAGFAIWDKSGDPDPVKVYKGDGPGLPETDFVLYVTSVNTQLCNPQKSSAMAYAASCQLDETGKPIAGQVNFCPRTVKAQKFDSDLTYMTALHELFHALGFSNKLFEKYLNCDEERNCTVRADSFLEPYEGIMRMVTPAVTREMRNHFDCRIQVDFGGPLEAMGDRASSHWDPILMHSSIMNAKEQKPYLTLIDKISLAVFEDTGWYRVDYSQADHFTWGKGRGCQFGFKSLCKHQEGFCTNNVTGCHYMRLSKARCSTYLSPYSECGIFSADQIPCFIESNTTSLTPDEIISPSSRCFVSSLVSSENTATVKTNTSPSTSGRCYERKCLHGNVFVRVKNGNWILCLPNSYVQVESYQGHIKCPTYEEVCPDFHVEKVDNMTSQYSFPVTHQNVVTETSSQSIPTGGNMKLSAEIHLISSTPLDTSLLNKLQDLLKKNPANENGWKIDDIGLWARKSRNQFHTHLCLSISSGSKELVDRSQVRKVLSSSVLDIFNEEMQHHMIIKVNNDNLIACPSSSHSGPKDKGNSAISMFPVPWATAFGLISAMIEFFSWISDLILL